MMSDIDRIIEFIHACHVLSLATNRGEMPWSANCFYAFDDTKMRFLVMSELTSRHGADMRDNAHVAGSIASQEADVSRLKGLQFSGLVAQLRGRDELVGRRDYCKRFPIALLSRCPLWGIDLEHIKYTNNTLGFGHKISWHRP